MTKCTDGAQVHRMMLGSEKKLLEDGEQYPNLLNGTSSSPIIGTIDHFSGVSCKLCKHRQAVVSYDNIIVVSQSF